MPGDVGRRRYAASSKVALAVSTSRSRSAHTATSQTEMVTLDPFSAPHRWHASRSAALREHVWTRAPNAANSSTMACPMPLLPLVTSAVAPVRLHLSYCPSRSLLAAAGW